MDATAAYPPQQTRSNLAGIGWMLVTGLFFVAVNGTVRWIGDDLPAAQSAFLRFVFGLLFLAVPLARALRTGFPAPVWRRFVLRGAIHVCAVVLWFYAMARIPVAEVTAIGFINPIVVTAGAALFLGERLGWRRVLAIGVALMGTAAHYCMSRAFQAAPMTVTQPVVFLQLIWANLLGVLAFGEAVDVWVIVGGAVMIGAISWITWREAQLARRRASALRIDEPGEHA